MTTTPREALGRRRAAAGYTQEDLAAHLAVATSTVKRWEAGTSEPVPATRPRLAKALDLTSQQLNALLNPASLSFPGHQPVPGETEVPSDPLTIMETLRAADQQNGGASLYLTVLNYLSHQIGPRLLLPDPGACSAPDIFTAAAGLTEMAGWMSHDAGNDSAANDHFGRSLALARVSQDQQLIAHVYASQAHLALRAQEHQQAAAFAHTALTDTPTSAAPPSLAARLHAMLARAHATAGNTRQCHQHLHQAHTLTAQPHHGAAPSPWISDFDEASLAAETHRCLTTLGDLHEAKRQAQRIITLRPPERARARAFGQLALASILLQQRQLEEACAVASEVLVTSRQMTSALVNQELHRFATVLTPFSATSEAAQFLQYYQQTLLTSPENS